MTALPTDRLRDMLSAAEALNCEQWGFVGDDDSNTILIVRAPNDAVVAQSEDDKRSRFIASNSPSTIASLVTELLALREAAKPFAHFYEQAIRLEQTVSLAQTFCDIQTGTSASLSRKNFRDIVQALGAPNAR